MLASEVREGLMVIHDTYGIGVVTVCIHDSYGLRCEVAFERNGYPYFVDFLEFTGESVNFEEYKGRC